MKNYTWQNTEDVFVNSQEKLGGRDDWRKFGKIEYEHSEIEDRLVPVSEPSNIVKKLSEITGINIAEYENFLKIDRARNNIRCALIRAIHNDLNEFNGETRSHSFSIVRIFNKVRVEITIFMECENGVPVKTGYTLTAGGVKLI